MTDKIEREVSQEEYDAIYDRTAKIMSDGLDKLLGEIEDEQLEAGAVIGTLLKHAGITAMALGLEKQFLQAVGTVTTMVMNKGEAPAGKASGTQLMEGFKVTARVNAAANDISVAGMVPLLLHAAVELANEEGRMTELIELIAGMGKLAEKMKERDAASGPTTH